MRRVIVWILLLCLVTTRPAAAASPHDEGTEAGRAANPEIRGWVDTPSASSAVPGYTLSPPERAYHGQPGLSGAANAQLSGCTFTPDDPVCQAHRGALSSAHTARPAVSPADPAVAGARDIARNPSAVLGGLGAYYAGCSTAPVTTPPGPTRRTCLRDHGGTGQLSCTRSLTVRAERTTSCTPGDWFAHGESGTFGLDVQCLPDRPDRAQHVRLTQHNTPLTFFDVDMSQAVRAPEMAAVLGPPSASGTGRPIRHGVWVADRACTGSTCTLTAMIASEVQERCTGDGDPGRSCTRVEPFLKDYATCRAGTQSGDNIQNPPCPEDRCTTDTLDRSQCYAPSGSSGSDTGTDVTGMLPGRMWRVDSPRAVTGWAPNPAYGPIPTLRLRYEKPATAVSTTDRWDDRCPALTAGGRCTVHTTAACTEGPSTKVIHGVSVTRDCWVYTSPLTCAGTTPVDACGSLASRGCTRGTSRCQQVNAGTGLCERYQDTYHCPADTQPVPTAANCPANVFCLGTICFNTNATSDPDFARTMSLMEAAREAGVYLDTDRMQVFKGEANRCRDRLLKNCCASDSAGAGMTNQRVFGTGSQLVYDVLMNADNRAFVSQGMSALLTGEGFSGSFTSYGVTVAVNGTALPAGSSVLYAGESMVIAFDPWSLVIAVVIYVVMSMMSCHQNEGRLAMQEGAGLCHSVGRYCSSCLRVLGKCTACLEHTTGKCCFNSQLARIVNEQGRLQLAKGWGSARQPDCSGFTVPQLQALDFAAMDLREFYASIVPTWPNVESLRRHSAERAPGCYYGQGRCE